MLSTYQLLLNGQSADADLYAAIASLEVEENLDLPGAVQLTLPVARTDGGDLSYVSDGRLQPLANLAVVIVPAAAAAGSAAGALAGAASALGVGGGGGPGAQCIFDGYVLSHKLHLEAGITNSTLTVWGQDASWLMNLEEKVKEWADVTDADVANSIFGDYGITPAADNQADESPSYSEPGHTLMQRGSDIQFLRTLARRNGKVCRVGCAGQAGRRTGYFATPKLSGDPAASLSLNDLQSWTVSALDLTWDATLATAVVARQAILSDSDEDGVSADTSDAGLPSLGDRGLAAFTGKALGVLLAAPADTAGELLLRARSLLRESAWFVRCEGETDLVRLGTVLRVGAVVTLDGVGPLHSGRYLVWSVRHKIGADAHKMKFVLVRNAVGPAPSGAGPAGLAGQLAGALNEQALMDVLERLRNRFFGKYRGTVTDVDAATLRIKAKVPEVLTDQPTGWCTPCVPYAGAGLGIAFLPEVGAGVWIEFEGGDVSLPIWTGCFWYDGQQPSDAAAAVKVIVTKAGKIVFDGDAGTITVSDGNNNSVTLGSDGITLQGGGSSVAISDDEVNINDGALEVLPG